jgi:hypothetical protein
MEEKTKKDGFILTEGDLEIFKLIYQHRFLRREHISALTGRPPKRLHRRLFKLVANGYLAVMVKLPQQKHIYALAMRAMPVLVEAGIAGTDVLRARLRAHELKPLFLAHEMMIVDLHVMLTLATRDEAIQLLSWEEGRELFDSVTVSEMGLVEKIPIRPDAFFTLEDSRRPPGANQSHFFLEADRSTATHTRFKEKMAGYWNYLMQGLHTKKYGIKSFRVLTITLTDARTENLCTLANALLPERAHRYYLFTSLKHFTLANPSPLLQDVFLSARSAGTSTRHPLVPPPTASHPSSASA